jgi:RecG-like helicase
MKKWMLIGMAVFTLLSLDLAAQVRRKMPDVEERARVMTERMAYRLNLSEEQKEEVLAINLQNAKKREAEMQKHREEMNARKAEKNAQDEQIKKILTEEQRKQWEEIKMDHRPGRRPDGMIEDQGNFHPRPPHRRGASR